MGRRRRPISRVRKVRIRNTSRVSHATRDIVLARDGYKCTICGTKGDRNNRLTMHHKKYRRNGGDGSVGNLVTICEQCHRKFHKEHG